MINKVTVGQIVKHLKMEVLCGEDYLDNEVTRSMTSRPGVEIYSDYFEFYESTRIQVIGTKELNLFYMISDEEKKKRVDKLFSFNPPAFIFTGHVTVIPQVFFEASKIYNVHIFKIKLYIFIN